MKYSTVAVTFATLIAGVIGQGIGDLPPCPSKCIFGGTAKTSCSLIDIACSCRDLAYQKQLAECMATCPPEEAAKGAQVGAAICKQAGVEISIPSITSTVAPPPTTTAAPVTTTTAEPEATTTPPAASTTTTAAEPEPTDDEEETTTTTPESSTTVPPTTLISVTAPVRPSPNATTNGTVTPPVATATPPTQDDESGAGKMMASSLLGVVVMGAVAFAL